MDGAKAGVSAETKQRMIPFSVCDRCKLTGTLGIDRRPLEGREGLFELLIVCHACGWQQHSCFISEYLERLSDKIQSESRPVERARLQRQYRRNFEQVQGLMRHALTPGPSPKMGEGRSSG